MFSECPYLVVAYNQHSSEEGHQICVLLHEKDGRLEKLPFIDKDGETLFSAGYYYNISTWDSTTDQLGSDLTISFDSRTNTLYIPQVVNSELTNRYDLYRYANEKMLYIATKLRK